MSTATLAGLVLVAMPLAFNVAFALLAARFDYPDILRRPTEEVLERFRAGGGALVLTGGLLIVVSGGGGVFGGFTFAVHERTSNVVPGL